MSDADQFLIKAKESVIFTDDRLNADDLYIVWFCKVLGNWKALISTDKWDGYYWEVTYNGAKQETYVDVYRKEYNVAIKDGDL